MLIQKDTINHLRDFGLNTYESKLWTALLSKGAASAGDLAELANVPRSRAYDVLESLEKKGFVIMKIGKPIKYLAVDPEHVLDRVRQRIAEEANIQATIVSQLEKSPLLDELKLLHKTGVKKIDPDEYSGIFRGKKNIHHYLSQVIKSARKSVLIQITDSTLSPVFELKSALKKASERGVKIFIAAPASEKNQDALKTLSKYAEFRLCEDSSHFYVVDGSELIFMLNSEMHPSYDSAIWVKSPFFVSAFKKMFLALWNSMAKM